MEGFTKLDGTRRSYIASHNRSVLSDAEQMTKLISAVGEDVTGSSTGRLIS